ncbi:MAG: hypothetical protein ACXVCY_06235 [Pseudobdellovibrionaceae bacterium]
MKNYIKTLMAAVVISNSVGMITYANTAKAQMTAQQADAGLADLKTQLGQLQLDLKEAQTKEDERVSVRIRNYGLTVDGLAVLAWIVSSLPEHGFIAVNETPIKTISIMAFIGGTVAAALGQVVIELSPSEVSNIEKKIDTMMSKINQIQEKMQH